MPLHDLPMKLSSLPSNAYEVHAMVYAAMLRPGTDDKRDFLFTTLPDMGGMVLIRSERFPGAMVRHAMPVEPPTNGQRQDFTLVASPMRSVLGESRKQPLPPNDSTARIEWLVKKGRRHGFDLKDCAVFSRPVLYERLGAKFHLERAEFYGTLVVTDEDKLKAALATGIGRARSLGHGMMRWI